VAFDDEAAGDADATLNSVSESEFDCAPPDTSSDSKTIIESAANARHST